LTGWTAEQSSGIEQKQSEHDFSKSEKSPLTSYFGSTLPSTRVLLVAAATSMLLLRSLHQAFGRPQEKVCVGENPQRIAKKK